MTVPSTPADWKNPEWDKPHRVHNWRNYVSDELIAIWDTFTDTQKQSLARMANEFADRENWD